jgi:hypothetical protein
MSVQTTLLTVHKGVDLHAATAVRVMRDRLDGGEALVRLLRADYHGFWTDDTGTPLSAGAAGTDATAAPAVERLLESGRYFNPNKHHYGHFVREAAGDPWDDAESRGAELPEGWPGPAVASDLAVLDDLYARLLGGEPGAGEVAVDVCAWPLGQPGPLRSGVLWRLVLRPEGRAPARLAERLVVTRSARLGLLVNPHMEAWRVGLRR